MVETNYVVWPFLRSVVVDVVLDLSDCVDKLKSLTEVTKKIEAWIYQCKKNISHFIVHKTSEMKKKFISNQTSI